LDEEGDGDIGPFSLSYRALNGDMVDLSIIVSSLSLGIKIDIGVFGNCGDCTMGGESVELLWRFPSRRWRWWVGFCLDLRIGVGWHWICDMW
jgi:hypothetical protein